MREEEDGFLLSTVPAWGEGAHGQRSMTLLNWASFPKTQGKREGHSTGLPWLCQPSLLVMAVAISWATQGSLPAKEQGRGFGVSSPQFNTVSGNGNRRYMQRKKGCRKLLAIIIFQIDIRCPWEFFIFASEILFHCTSNVAQRIPLNIINLFTSCTILLLVICQKLLNIFWTTIIFCYFQVKLFLVCFFFLSYFTKNNRSFFSVWWTEILDEYRKHSISLRWAFEGRIVSLKNKRIY